MAVTQSTDIYDPVIITDAVRGFLKGKMGLMGSVLVTSGAVRVNGTMPMRGRQAIGKSIKMPYWGIMGDFEDLTESQSPTPQKIAMNSEDATVARASIAFEVSTWAQGQANSAGFENPVDIQAQACAERAKRKMDSIMIKTGQDSPLLVSDYSATVPNYMTWQKVLRAKANKLGDESPAIVAMVVHSLVAADLASQTDSNGRPILSDPKVGEAQTVSGIPILISDRMPLTGSTMSTLVGPYTTATGTSAGSGSATYTISVSDVTKLGPWNLVVKVEGTGECGTSKIKFSTDGGNTWSASITTAASGAATSLVDTAVDSLVGNNGETGVSVTFTSGSGNDFTDGEFYRSNANLCCESQIWMPGAGAFWYNEAALGLKTDVDILEDTDLGAMHLYYAAKVYRRRDGGSRPGVLRIKTNAGGFIG